jgi:hypothetical protein
MRGDQNLLCKIETGKTIPAIFTSDPLRNADTTTEKKE